MHLIGVLHMSDTPKDIAHLLQLLEERLLDQAVRKTPLIVNHLLADDFIEFGTSGGVYNKQEIVDALANEPMENAPILSASDFAVRTLAEGIIQVTYRSVRRVRDTGQERHSLRSSIWKFIGGRWQMIFHQGTWIPQARDKI
ncbi:DUF4440 domain-containing protein [Phyllobacterium sp. 628]|uniref:nuclear transport factor 2 family protein n=1 Tax=Phyllobacterium sp. 628 TaxID=2718938 RepID=UPI001AED3E6B|nr:DUF4440 domain-containing protein [Phyllobacterium sp. 628]